MLYGSKEEPIENLVLCMICVTFEFLSFFYWRKVQMSFISYDEYTDIRTKMHYYSLALFFFSLHILLTFYFFASKLLFMFSCISTLSNVFSECSTPCILYYTYSWPDENCILPYGFDAVYEKPIRVAHCTFTLSQSQCWLMGSGRSILSFYGSLHIFNQKLILPLWSHLNIHGRIHVHCTLCSAHMDNGYTHIS